jgi:hypothetical protein
MQRREALRLMISGAALPALTPEAFGIFRAAHPAAGYAPRTLNPRQYATVVAMTDLIIPETDTPGAKGAGVNEFIDLILTEWATEEERAGFLSGLAGVDKQSNELFGKDFAEGTAAQQTALLLAIEDGAMPDHNAMRRENSPTVHDQQLKGNFWLVFKNITLHGYYTSEIGFSKELKLTIIPGAHHGCAPVGTA